MAATCITSMALRSMSGCHKCRTCRSNNFNFLQGFHQCFQQECNWFSTSRQTILTLVALRKTFLFKWSSQVSKIIETASQFAWCPALSKTCPCGMMTLLNSILKVIDPPSRKIPQVKGRTIGSQSSD